MRLFDSDLNNSWQERNRHGPEALSRDTRHPTKGYPNIPQERTSGLEGCRTRSSFRELGATLGTFGVIIFPHSAAIGAMVALLQVSTIRPGMPMSQNSTTPLLQIRV